MHVSKDDGVNDDETAFYAAEGIRSAALYVRRYGHTDTRHYILGL